MHDLYKKQIEGEICRRDCYLIGAWVGIHRQKIFFKI
jgi:hypothetical protein